MNKIKIFDRTAIYMSVWTHLYQFRSDGFNGSQVEISNLTNGINTLTYMYRQAQCDLQEYIGNFQKSLDKRRLIEGNGLTGRKPEGGRTSFRGLVAIAETSFTVKFVSLFCLSLLT